MDIRHSFKNQIIALTLLTSVAFTFSRCKKDSLEETQLEAIGSPMIDVVQSEALAADGITSDSYYLENALPSGYVKDGSRDYTSYVQAAVTKYSNIVFPAFPILVNDKGISIGSNKTITFKEGSEIRLKGTSNDKYTILSISSASNITLYNPVVIGDRNSHIGTSGEHGVGIGIRGSSNITVYSPKVTNSWGDGIYIGQASSSINCKNIVIKDAYLYKNRRDGISIIGVDGLLIDNIYAGYSDGTTPMSGINFEPNNTASEIKNVKINNPRTEKNGMNGIQIGLGNMLGSSNKTSDITIVNHVDNGSPRYAFKMRVNNVSGGSGKMYGSINLVNPTWNKTETDQPLYVSSNQTTYKTIVSSPEVATKSGTLLSWTATYDLLMKQARFASLSVNNDFDSSLIPPTTVANPIPAGAGTVVFAVNAGGADFKASNGITYSADKNYVNGRLYKTTSAIANTNDDALYQNERYGNFSYNIPVANGTYEVTFKLAELYHSASSKRRFDILGESQELVSNLDLFAVAPGKLKAHDIVKTVTVSDGTLNLSFKTELDNASIAAFHVTKK